MSHSIGFTGLNFVWSSDIQPTMGVNMIAWGLVADYGRVVQVTAAPAGTTRDLPLYEQIIIVNQLRSEIGSDHGRRIFFGIQNLSKDIVYEVNIAIAYSDVI